MADSLQSPRWLREPIKAAIFDMDGLLMETETYWRLAEREVFAQVGLEITDEMARATRLMTTREATLHWHALHPWDLPSIETVESDVIHQVRRLVTRHGRAKPGVAQIIDACRARGWRLGLASNSPQLVIDAVLSRLRLSDVLAVAVSSEQVRQGKPSPCVYLEAACRLQVEPRHCLALEDSAPGVQAARSAGMTVIAISPKAWEIDDAGAAPHGSHRSLIDLANALESGPSFSQQ